MPYLKTLFLFIIVALFSACSDRPNTQTFQLSGNTMGTSYSIIVVGEKTIDPLLVTAALEDIENTMSTYRSNSELMRLNVAPLNTWITISQSLNEILRLSETIFQLSFGAFDPTLAPLVNLWGFGPDKSNFDSPPSANEIMFEMENIGYQHLIFSEDRPAVLKNKLVNLDLSAIAKGYAVDMISTLLETKEIKNYLVEIGGEIKTKGLNAEGDLWRVAIETPEANASIREPIRILRISNMSIASSGDYRNFIEIEGEHYSHTIDPRNGMPIRHDLASVTVIAESSAIADALATAFNVMGVEQAMVLANNNDIPVYFLSKTVDGFTESYSTAFTPYLNKL